MKIIEVKGKKLLSDFLLLPNTIYKNDPNWISPLFKDIEAVFDSKRNPFFEFGIATRWVLYDDDKKAIGRIGAFINRVLAYSYTHPTGGVGFFECIDDKQAATLLFDTARQWLADRGMEAMEGPINFGERNRFWGLLVDGFDKPPVYQMNYNPPWYRKLFEDYGFQNYFEQFVYGLGRDTVLTPIVHRHYERLTRDQGYDFAHLDLRNKEKYAADFLHIYNQAWKDVRKDFKPITEQQVMKLFHDLKPIIDPELIIFAYHNNSPIAMFVGLPEMNRIFRHFKGKLGWKEKLKFLYLRWKGECDAVHGIVFGVVPEYRNKGVVSGLIISIHKTIMGRSRYKSIYLDWIGDFNPKMIRIAELLTKEKVFTLITYRYMFRKEHQFSRHPVIE